MGLPKGRTNNKAGRPKGKPNKITSDLRSWVNDLVNNNREQMISDLKKLSPDKRLMFLEKLMSYTIPKMQQSDNRTALTLDSASDSEIWRIANEILKSV